MTTRIGRPPRSEKPRFPIGTSELLTAIAELGPNWPARFVRHEIVDVNEALDRELLAGHLRDAVTLSDRGFRVLSTSDTPGTGQWSDPQGAPPPSPPLIPS